MNEYGKSGSLPSDNPIRDRQDDVLERTAMADALARQALDLDASEGIVVGVFGPWGSGKTSLINLARGTFESEGVPVLDFNPWLFSGAEQLVERFFAELSASMGMKNELKEVAEAFEKYGTAFNAVVGAVSTLLAMPQVGAIVKAATDTAGTAKQPESVDARRTKIENALRARGKPIVVVLDDVDRLSAPEIREIFKLVRLTASFPNVIYIVCCDRLRVEQALGEQGLSGRDYLEKIIQWSFNLREVPAHLLNQQLFEAIENALVGIQTPGPFDKDSWGDVYRGILRPLIRNMRDVRRFAMAIRETVGGLEGRVAQADVLALEAVRMFLPDVFRLFPGAIDGLTVSSRPLEREIDRMLPHDFSDTSTAFNERCKARVNGLIEATKKHGEREADPDAAEVVRAMLDCLFPAAARLRQTSDRDSESHATDDATGLLTERRVAHENILRLYLEGVVNPDLLAFHDAERALDRMTDRVATDEFIRSLEPTRRRDIVSNLCKLMSRIPQERVEPGIVMLLNLWSDTPEPPFELSILVNDLTGHVRTATRRLLETLQGAAAVETAVRRILPELTSFSAKLGLIRRVEQQDSAHRRLVSESVSNEFEGRLRNEIRAASASDLAEERDPLEVLHFAYCNGGTPDDPLELGDCPRLTFALLRSVRQEPETGTGPVRRFVEQDWKRVVDLYGGEEVLKTRINVLKVRFESLKPWIEARGMPLDESEHLLELANRYLTGSRPEAD